MPPKAKTEEPVLGPAPANLSDLCTECDPRELDPSTTQLSCPHGSWSFAPGDKAAPPSLDEQVAQALDGLTVEQLQALLNAKTAK